MAKKISYLLVLVLLLCIESRAKTLKIKKTDMHKLSKMISGNYHNEMQWREDKNFPHTLLRIKQVWTDEINGYWFYAEQTPAASEGAPDWQRMYHLFLKDDTTAELKMYKLKNPNEYAGAWNDEGRIAALNIESLLDISGCSVFLKKRKSNVYSGATDWGRCTDDRKGAAYASAEIVIYKKKMVIWERGWNDKNNQVWGLLKGGISFIKKSKAD